MRSTKVRPARDALNVTRTLKSATSCRSGDVLLDRYHKVTMTTPLGKKCHKTGDVGNAPDPTLRPIFLFLPESLADSVAVSAPIALAPSA
jgi:hypothetical protein